MGILWCWVCLASWGFVNGKRVMYQIRYSWIMIYTSISSPVRIIGIAVFYDSDLSLYQLKKKDSDLSDPEAVCVTLTLFNEVWWTPIFLVESVKLFELGMMIADLMDVWMNCTVLEFDDKISIQGMMFPWFVVGFMPILRCDWPADLFAWIILEIISFWSIRIFIVPWCTDVTNVMV